MSGQFGGMCLEYASVLFCDLFILCYFRYRGQTHFGSGIEIIGYGRNLKQECDSGKYGTCCACRQNIKGIFAFAGAGRAR